MKNKYIMIVICIIAMTLLRCNSKEKQENASKEIATYDLKKGNYYSENDNSFIMLDVYRKEFVLAKEEKIKEGMSGDVYGYEIKGNNLIATNEASEEVVIDIVDDQTLKLQDEVFVYKKSDTNNMVVKAGIYYSETTAAYFWIEDNQTMKYVFEGASASNEYAYVTDGNILMAASWAGTYNCEILNDNSIKIGEDIFVLSSEE